MANQELDNESYYKEARYERKPENSFHDLTKEFWQFIKTRPSTLFQLPVFDKKNKELAKKRLNPMPAIRAMDRHQWNLFLHGYSAWLCDSFDFFCVSISVSDIADTFGVEVVSITWGMTLVLMLRSIGSIIFGFIADRYGRKWPLIACYVFFIIFEIATGFTQTLKQFLAVRALFGIAMGGCYGLAMSTSLEDAPVASRGFLSGIWQPAYTFGFVLATAFHRAFYDTSKHWRALFWFSALPALLLLIWRLTFGELDYFKQLQEARKLHNQRVHEEKEVSSLSDNEKNSNGDNHLTESNLFNDFIQTLKTDWPILVYLIFNLSVFNFLSHGSQDLFPTMLKKQIGLSTNALTVTNVVVNLGGCFGGPFWGQLSEILGRRLAMIGACCCVGAFIYPTFFIHQQSYIMGCGFMLQFSIMGAWGVLPIYLTELTATTPLRALISGTAYQVGTLASSASSTIEAELGRRFPITSLGKGGYDYGKVMCIFLGAVTGFMIITLFFGPERFHQMIKTDFMLEEQDVDSDFALERVISTVPTSPEEAKLRAQRVHDAKLQEQE